MGGFFKQGLNAPSGMTGVKRGRGMHFEGGRSNEPEYRNANNIAYAQATAQLRGDKPSGLHDFYKGTDGKWHERWKTPMDPTTFAILNADTSGLYRAAQKGPYGDPNTFIDNQGEYDMYRSKGLPHYRNRMGMGSFAGPGGRMVQGRFGRSMDVYKRLGMNAPPGLRGGVPAEQVAGLVESGLYKPGEMFNRYMGGGIQAKMRDFKAGHTAIGTLQKRQQDQSAQVHKWQDEQGLTRNQLPTNEEFYDQYVAPTLERRSEWDRTHKAPKTAFGQTSQNPFAQYDWLDDYEEWKPHVDSENALAEERAARLRKGGDMEWLGRYRPGHPDDPTMDEALRRLGLLEGQTPTAEGLRILEIVKNGNGVMG